LETGPVFEVIAGGAIQLPLGFNDEWYNDNCGGLSVKVTEVAGVAAPVPPGFWFEWTISIPP
jgi:hypothetical protein